MTARPPVRSVLVAIVGLVGILAAWAAAPGGGTAVAASSHRAVVVIDDGVRRTSTCVRFSTASITGIDALRRAVEPDPVTASFGSGEAVCGIGGVGCPVSGCLTCQAPAYWHYYRATGGGPLRYAATGASATAVQDGDIEAWVWGSTVAAGTVPSISGVCGLEPPDDPPATPAPTTATPAPTPRPTVPASGTAAGPPGSAPSSTSVVPAPEDPDAADVETPTTAAPSAGDPTEGDTRPGSDADADADTADDTELAGEPVAAVADEPASSPSVLALLLFVVLAGGSVVGVVLLRRRPRDDT